MIPDIHKALLAFSLVGLTLLFAQTFGNIGQPTWTFSTLPALSNGYMGYCSDCQPTSASNAVCASGGTGAFAQRVNGAWLCWSAAFTGGSGGSVPSGSIVLITSGICPTGFTEATALDGVMLRGTLAAHGDVGTTGGADTITPAGTVAAPTFTGASDTTSAVGAGTPAGTNSACATVKFTTSGSGTAACSPAFTPTFTGTALGTHTHTVTATGTNSAPAFTGTAFDNRPAFVKVIFCSKT